MANSWNCHTRHFCTLIPFATHYSLPSQIHFDHPLIRRNLIDGSFGQHRAFVQAGHLDAELAHEGHVVFDDHDGFLAIDFREQLGGLMGLDVGHAGDRLVDQQQFRILRQQHADLEPLLLAVRQAPRQPVTCVGQPDGFQHPLDAFGFGFAFAPEQRAPDAMIDIQRQQQIVFDGLALEYRRLLELAADPEFGDPGFVEPGQVGDAIEQHRALIRLDETRIAELGIGRKFQKPTVFESQTVEDNLLLALNVDHSVKATLFWRGSKGESERIERVLETIRLTDARGRLAGSLSHGQKQWLEIGMLLAQDPKLLLVDEPVAGMTDVETHLTAELLKEINREKTIMVVEHDMTFVRELGVKVTCLHEGTVLAEGTIDQVSSNERVIEVYLGR